MSSPSLAKSAANFGVGYLGSRALGVNRTASTVIGLGFGAKSPFFGGRRSRRSGRKNWVTKAERSMKHPGALSRKARRAGMSTGAFACKSLRSKNIQTRRQAQFYVNINKSHKCSRLRGGNEPMPLLVGTQNCLNETDEDGLIDPITGNNIVAPIVRIPLKEDFRSDDGFAPDTKFHCFGRETLFSWLQNHSTNPSTGLRLTGPQALYIMEALGITDSFENVPPGLQRAFLESEEGLMI